jgi:hypothetical protein
MSLSDSDNTPIIQKMRGDNNDSYQDKMGICRLTGEGCDSQRSGRNIAMRFRSKLIDPEWRGFQVAVQLPARNPLD